MPPRETGAAVLDRIVHGLHLPSTHLGILGAAQGAGSIAGGLVVGRLIARLGAARTAVQTGTPGHLLGRVSATSTTVMFGPVALAIPAGSALVQAGGRLPLLTAATLATATAAWASSARGA